ncbi:MAG: YdcF family protein [Alphaproteobacteria bacterium]|nr:YdcF family protein [Alphaproteobacteria bacterium]
MFWIASKIFWIVFNPLALAALLVCAGWLFTLGRRKGMGLALVTTGLLLLVVASFTNIGTLLLQPLENRYQRPAEFPADAAGIIVLGGGVDNTVSAARGAFELGDSGDRYVEALRLALAHPEMPVLVSGGIGSLSGAGETEAASIARLFDAFGVPEGRILFEARSRNTEENAVLSAQVLNPQKGQRFVLVTSAFHMPRSVGLFETAGFDIVPWPVDYHTTGTDGLSFTPDQTDASMSMSAMAMREWIGLFVYWATGKIPTLVP